MALIYNVHPSYLNWRLNTYLTFLKDRQTDRPTIGQRQQTFFLQTLKKCALAAWEASFFFWLFIKTTMRSLAPSNTLSASQYCKTTNQMNQLKLADAIILTAIFPLDRSTFWHCILKSYLPSNNMILTYEAQGVNVASTHLFGVKGQLDHW